MMQTFELVEIQRLQFDEFVPSEEDYLFRSIYTSMPIKYKQNSMLKSNQNLITLKVYYHTLVDHPHRYRHFQHQSRLLVASYFRELESHARCLIH